MVRHLNLTEHSMNKDEENKMEKIAMAIKEALEKALEGVEGAEVIFGGMVDGNTDMEEKMNEMMANQTIKRMKEDFESMEHAIAKFFAGKKIHGNFDQQDLNRAATIFAFVASSFQTRLHEKEGSSQETYSAAAKDFNLKLLELMRVHLDIDTSTKMYSMNDFFKGAENSEEVK